MRAFAQVLGLAALWWVSDLAMRWLHLPVPGSVAGLGILVLLLRTGLLPLAWVKEGADWLLAVILLGTVTVMVGTALVVERVFRLEHRLLLRRRED